MELIKSLTLILNVSNPIDEISRSSSSSSVVTINEKVPSLVLVVPRFFFIIPTAAYGISKLLSSTTEPSIKILSWEKEKTERNKNEI